MTGGQTGLQVALHITGIHAKDTADAVKAIGDAAKGTQKNVSDWDKVQGTHNQKMAEFAAWTNKAGINIGTVLLPAVDHFTTNLMYGGKQWGDIFASVGKWWGDTVSSFRYGAQQIGGFVHGIGANFEHGRQQIIGAFKGASHWLIDAGKDAVAGLVLGFHIAVPDLTATVNWMASLIPTSVKKALNINSPSKVMIPLGQSVGEGLQVGILGSAKQLQSATKSLSTMVIGMFEKGSIGSSTERAALRTVQSGTHTLIAEANKRAALAKQITATQKTLTSELAKQKKLQDSTVVSSTVEAGNVTQAGSSGAMIENLQNLVTGTRRFKSDLQRLVKGGIDQDTFKQLVAAGVSGGGLAAADELLANPMDFKQVVALQRQLAAGANSLGSFAAQTEYRPSINATKAKLATLKGAQQVETWKMQSTAAGMINAIAREAHVHIHLSGHYAGTKDELAKSVTTAIRDAVRRGQLPKNVLTAL
jgi:hypothetical protein